MLVKNILYIEDIPPECIKDCSGPGQADIPVHDWREKLDFEVNRENAIKCLDGYGAWDDLETWTDKRLAETVLWLACGNFNEWDGTENSNCGSDIFCLE
jgi:hypothetical protein